MNPLKSRGLHLSGGDVRLVYDNSAQHGPSFPMRVFDQPPKMVAYLIMDLQPFRTTGIGQLLVAEEALFTCSFSDGLVRLVEIQTSSCSPL